MKFETVDYTKELPAFFAPTEQHGVKIESTSEVFALVKLKGAGNIWKLLVIFEKCTQYGKTKTFIREVRRSRSGKHIQDFSIWGHHNIPIENIVSLHWLRSE